MNIYIPSKGRHNSSKLIEYVNKNRQTDNRIKIVVEPNELLKYKEKYPSLNFVELPLNNMGITFARNFIKEYSKNNNELFYWQLDDDISGFYRREGTKLIKCDMLEAIEYATSKFIEIGSCVGQIEYRQLAWSASKEFITNSFCDSCVFVNNILSKDINYRQYVEGKEDRDFAMQVISNGQKTNRITTYAFSAPENGSNAGGLKESFYDVTGKEKECCKRMIELWGIDICQLIIKNNGREDLKINWKKINSKQKSLF